MVGRVRVLQPIIEAGEIHITSLSRKTNLNHTSVSRPVEVLKKLGLDRNLWRRGVLESAIRIDLKLSRAISRLDTIVDGLQGA